MDYDDEKMMDKESEYSSCQTSSCSKVPRNRSLRSKSSAVYSLLAILLSVIGCYFDGTSSRIKAPVYY